MTVEQFIEKWLIRNSIDYKSNYTKPSVVYKYLDQKYIDLFFNEGIIKLGKFDEYKSIEDSSRADYQEGTHEFKVWNKDRSHFKTLRRFTGSYCAIYCTSTSNNFTELGERFGANGYFKITNTILFAFEIAKALKPFLVGLEGPAIYSEDGKTDFFTGQYKVPDFNETTPMNELFYTCDIISKINFDQYYSKRQTPYEIEKEYRFVWLLSENLSNTDLLIHCPDAIKYCRKIT